MYDGAEMRMAKRKPPVKRKAKASPAEPAAAPPEDPFAYGADLPLHQLFEQQTRQMLDRSDLDEEQKQHILIAMSCPCCGGGAMSYTAKLKR
jgi:hypothetical protein